MNRKDTFGVLLKIGINFARLLLAIVFIFSGFVKAVDPMGMVYKLNEYLAYFNLLPYFSLSLVKIMAVMMALIEFVLGIYLLFAIRRRFTSKVLLALMVVLLPFTLFIAIKNPVTDCGCFGDALFLTNWQTFYKNIILSACAVLIAWKPLLMPRLISERNQWIVSVYSILFIFAFSLYSFHYLPMIDFRPYKIGTNIHEEMTVPRGAPEPVYHTEFILEKNGRRQTFTLDNYPDSTWTYVDTKTTLVTPGYIPPIRDFYISDEKGNDVTNAILTDTVPTFLLISPQFAQADDGTFDAINAIFDFAVDHGLKFYAVTASLPADWRIWKETTGAEYPRLVADETLLKTIVRSNPGLVLLRNGTIISKWSCNNLPDSAEIQENLKLSKISRQYLSPLSVEYFKVILIYVLPLLLLTLCDRVWVGRKMYKQYKARLK